MNLIRTKELDENDHDPMCHGGERENGSRCKTF